MIAEVHDPFPPPGIRSRNKQQACHALRRERIEMYGEEKAMARGFSKLFVKPRAEDV